tara:strand:+ start:2381 stop:2671 length:291 start_codon:yes stop_codon:yes gene_type:complete
MNKKNSLPKPIDQLYGYKFRNIQGGIFIFTGKKSFDENPPKGFKNLDKAKDYVKIIMAEKADKKMLAIADNPYLSSLSNAKKRISGYNKMKKALKS